MSEGVLSLLEQHTGLVNSIPAFANVQNALQNNVNEMNAALGILFRNNKGITIAKNKARLALANETAVLAGTLSVLAVQNNLYELRGKVKMPPSLLKVLGGTRLLAIARMVKNELTTHLPLLAGYTIHAGTLTRFESLIDGFASVLATPQQAATHRQATTIRLRELVIRNRQLIEWQLKPLLQLFRAEQPSFWGAMTENLRIGDAYTRHTRIKGTVADASTGEVLPGASVEVAGTDHAATTDENGEYSIYVPQKGSYTLRISKQGYEALSLPDIIIRTGHATRQDAALEKITADSEQIMDKRE